jgi:SAM-dependent methyltransferase
MSTLTASRSRLESNRILRHWGREITGRVLSIGSAKDQDSEGGTYRKYFPLADAYLTSEVRPDVNADLHLDVRSMPSIATGSFDAVLCSGVLEHVDNFQAAISEMHRVLKVDELLMLGTPFRQGLHRAPQDFWRFTEYGIRHLLGPAFAIENLVGVDADDSKFPAGYWTLARKVAE